MKYCVNLGCCSKRLPAKELLPLVKDAGFDACFLDGGNGDELRAMAAEIRKEGLILQSIHAPFNEVHRMWETGPEGDRVQASLTRYLEDCASAGAPMMVCHVFIGFGEEHPNSVGVERFGALVKRAEELGMKIAFENTEGESYLQTVKQHLWSSPAAGFCIDTGHEMCYNRSRDLIRAYGADGKLFCTHLNDNLGITGETITWKDDAHLLPFDGVADWEGIASRLCDVGYDGVLTMELTLHNKPDRHTHDRYDALTTAEFLSEARSRAERLAHLMEAAKK